MRLPFVLIGGIAVIIVGIAVFLFATPGESEDTTASATTGGQVEVAAASDASATDAPQPVSSSSPAVATVDRINALWQGSPHADKAAEAFRHWDKEGSVPPVCATCHSTDGFLDFLGADGSTVGKVDKPAHPTDMGIDCNTCHTEKASTLASVTFPSGFIVQHVDGSGRCMVCHQGRESTASVEKAVAGMEIDLVSDALKFINVHYRAAAATLYGGDAKGGFQYAGKSYVGKFNHVPNADTCIECHEPHSTKVVEASCSTCHSGKPPAEIRMKQTDFDGDGDMAEGIHGEVATLHEKLGKAIQAYSKDVAKAPILYDAHAYPYFFNDTNGNGSADEGEVKFPNAYKSWTPRLLQAAYNYQYVAKDPGAYAHNPSYTLQLLYDSMESLAAEVQVDMAGLVRP